MEDIITSEKIETDQIIIKLSEIFRDVFDDKTIIVHSNMTSGEIAGWDSLSHMLMIDEVEKKFGVKFRLKEIASLENVGKLILLIGSKLKTKANKV